METLIVKTTVKRTARRAAAGAALALTAFAACKKTGQANGDVTRNWTPPVQDTVMGVATSAVTSAIQQRLGSNAPDHVTSDQWKHVKHLYSTFSNNLLWLTDKGVHQARVSALLNTLASADSDALDLSDYPLSQLGVALASVDGKHPTAEQLADADVLLSSAYVTYGENMLTGQYSPSDLGQSWHINPEEEHVDSALTLTLREDDFAGGLTRMRPQDPGYDSLRTELVRYRAIVARGAWPTVPDGPQLKPGDKDSPARLSALRARLSAEGYLAAGDSGAAASGAAARPNVYDRQLAGAVGEFQARHSIGVDSMLGKETLDAINEPADYRLAQIAANLERYRWLPRTLGQRYILVNVPQFHLDAYDSGQKVLEMKVIVGQEYEDKATPVFSDSMEYVIFRPYWDVTPDIAAKEIFPKVAANPDYLAANDMEIYNDHGQRAVRQRPGPKNSLGLVKFIFPNDYNIYLHDTPARSLFDKDVRAFSHGCIRVEKPAELAQWVLGWPADKVDQAMHDGPDDHQVNLPKKLPVYIVYFTTFVQNGVLNFGNDLYDRDSKLVAQVQAASNPSAEAMRAEAALRGLATE